MCYTLTDHTAAPLAGRYIAIFGYQGCMYKQLVFPNRNFNIYCFRSALVCLDSETIPALNNPKMAADVTVDAGDEVCACTYPHVPERLQVQLHYFDLLPFSVTVNLRLIKQSELLRKHLGLRGDDIASLRTRKIESVFFGVFTPPHPRSCVQFAFP